MIEGLGHFDCEDAMIFYIRIVNIDSTAEEWGVGDHT